MKRRASERLKLLSKYQLYQKISIKEIVEIVRDIVIRNVQDGMLFVIQRNCFIVPCVTECKFPKSTVQS